MAGRTPAPCARPCAGAPTAQPPDWSAARASLRSALAVLRRSRSAGAASAAAARHRCPTISVTLACVQPHVLARRRRQNVKSVRRLAENLPPVGMRQRVRWCIGFRAERRAHIILQRSEQRRRLLGRLSGERRYPYGAAIGEQDRLALPGRCARRERCRRFRQRFRHRMRRAPIVQCGPRLPHASCDLYERGRIGRHGQHDEDGGDRARRWTGASITPHPSLVRGDGWRRSHRCRDRRVP